MHSERENERSAGWNEQARAQDVRRSGVGKTAATPSLEPPLGYARN